MSYRILATGCDSTRDFAARLVGEITPGEWRQLKEGGFAGEISDFNRGVLLRLRECDSRDIMDAPFDADGAGRMADMLEDFLSLHLSDNLPAQRWIALSCLALAFVFREPLHPVEVVKARVRMVDGRAAYFCPAREGDETLCGYCVCHPVSELA